MTRAGCTTIGKGIMLLACALGAQAVLISVGLAQTVWRPPPLGRTSTPAATVPKELVSSLRIGSVPVILAKTPLADVQAKLGGTLGHVGDAGDFLSWLCVRGADQRGRWVLWLESAEIDEDLVGSFQLRRIPRTARVDRRCTTLQDAAAVVELSIKLELGMPRVRVLQILGQPSVETGHTLIYLHQHEEIKTGDPTDPRPFPVRNNLVILLRQSTVHAIGAAKYTLW